MATTCWQNECESGVSRWLAHGEGIVDFLREVGAALLPTGNFRLVMLELDGEPVAAELAIAGGTDSESVNVGWDERFKRYAPATLSLPLSL